MADSTSKQMVCIGPAALIQKNLRDALELVKAAMTTMSEGRARPRRAALIEAHNDLDVARELLMPIVDAVEGRGAPLPARKPPALPKAQQRAMANLARAMIAAADEQTGEAVDDAERVH